MSSLDLFSISQTNAKKRDAKLSTAKKKNMDACMNNAPYFAYQIGGKKWGIVQGCCNNWNCPKCGQTRARQEYGRIVAGAREIAKTDALYLMTLTCRGRDVSLEEAENHYLEWTNSLLTRLRTSQKRSGKKWLYASVTERQKRRHPHSHFITTYCPDDALEVKKGKWKYFHVVPKRIRAPHNTLQSEYLERACAECGLGYQYDISRLESVEAGSRYAAKYLFKEGIFSTIWPKGWRRVRYSNGWPTLPEQSGDAIVLLSAMDWYRLSKEAVTLVVRDEMSLNLARRNLIGSDVIIQ